MFSCLQIYILLSEFSGLNTNSVVNYDMTVQKRKKQMEILLVYLCSCSPNLYIVPVYPPDSNNTMSILAVIFTHFYN